MQIRGGDMKFADRSLKATMLAVFHVQAEISP
jgi:hypothetical protein